MRRFHENICNAFFLTGSVKKRAETKSFGKLEPCLLNLEDLFLLKSTTGREGDLEDMAIIVRQGGGLRWNTVLEIYFEEEKKIRQHLCLTILDSIELLQEKENLRIPIHKPLLRHCVDIGIFQLVYRGTTSVKEIRGLMNFPEYVIRNRVAKLVKEGKLSKLAGEGDSP